MRIKITEKQLEALKFSQQKKVVRLTESQFNKLFDINPNEAKKSFEEAFGSNEMTIKEFASELKNGFKGLMSGDQSKIHEMCGVMGVPTEVFMERMSEMGMYEMTLKEDGGYAKIKKEGFKDKIKELYEEFVLGETKDENIIDEYNDPREDDRDYQPAYTPKEDKFNVLYLNNEMAILSDDEGNKFFFYYYDIDKDDFSDYADREVLSATRDEDGDMDIEYGEFDINDEVIENYVNDNYESFSIGSFGDEVDLTPIDSENTNEILSHYSEEASEITKVLGNIEEGTGTSGSMGLSGTRAGASVTPFFLAKDDKNHRFGKKPVYQGGVLVAEEEEEEEIHDGYTPLVVEDSDSEAFKRMIDDLRSKNEFPNSPADDKTFPNKTIENEYNSGEFKKAWINYRNETSRLTEVEETEMKEFDPKLGELYKRIKMVNDLIINNGDKKYEITFVEKPELIRLIPFEITKHGDVITRFDRFANETDFSRQKRERYIIEDEPTLVNGPKPSEHLKNDLAIYETAIQNDKMGYATKVNYEAKPIKIEKTEKQRSKIDESNFDEPAYHPDGKFVEFDPCVKIGNKGGQDGKCSQGAIDNVVKLKDKINTPK